jgi:hypothetical protein
MTHIYGPHLKEYEKFTEIVPGVFYEPGEAVYIVDGKGEVCCWNADEWAEDPTAITATIVAVALAASKGPIAVRENLASKGNTVQSLINGTFSKTHPDEN